ncbi:MAG: tautomerase family protein [Pseudomonadota bacterium]
MQVKIYGEKSHLTRHRAAISDAIHRANQDIMGLPDDKRFHRLIGLEPEDFIHPADRGDAYTIIEILMFEGRSRSTCRRLLERLMSDVAAAIGCDVEAVEVTLIETPRANWGIRGKVADQLTLNYDVET